MRLHNNNEELFKEKLKSHGIDPFDAGKVRDITTGNQLKKSHWWFDYSKKIRDEMSLSFVIQHLIKRKASFSDQIKKFNLDVNWRKRKRFGKKFQLWKKLGKCFGVMLSKEVNLEEAFRYPVTSVSLNLAFPHSNITQNPKHHFRNYLIDVSKACESTPQMKPAG